MTRSRKNIVRVTESQLHNIIKESIKKCLVSEVHLSGNHYYGEMFPNQPFNSEEEYYAAVEKHLKPYGDRLKQREKEKKERQHMEKLPRMIKTIREILLDQFTIEGSSYEEYEAKTVEMNSDNNINGQTKFWVDMSSGTPFSPNFELCLSFIVSNRNPLKVKTVDIYHVDRDEDLDMDEETVRKELNSVIRKWYNRYQ